MLAPFPGECAPRLHVECGSSADAPRGRGFVHLHVHSYYSFFDSTLSPEDIVRLAKGMDPVGGNDNFSDPVGDFLNLPKADGVSGLEKDGIDGAAPSTTGPEKTSGTCVALTDTNCLTGAVEFYRAAVAAGVKPILGAEVTQPYPAGRALLRARAGAPRVPPEEGDDRLRLHPGGRDDGSASPALCHGDHSCRVVVLARNMRGYSRISRLVTRRMLDPDFDLIGEVARLGADVVAFSDSPEVLEAMAASAHPVAMRYAMLAPSRRQRRRNRTVYGTAKRLGMPLVIACDVKMASAVDAPLHDLLQAMRRLTTVARIAEGERIDPAQHFQAEDAIRAFFGLPPDGDPRAAGDELRIDLAAALGNMRTIADACDCRLPLGEWKFPHFGAPQATDTAHTLRELVEAGMRERYGDPPPPDAVERMNHELAVIGKLRFTGYFLLVHRIVAEARSRGFFTLGRGSAANSIVTYALRISNVCPLRNQLCFERFLNPERSSPPDIDIDFSWRERDEILEWCFGFFGSDRVALISTIQTLRSRQAVREVAKAHGICEREVNAFNRLKSVGYMVEEGTGGGVDSSTFHNLALEEPWRTVMEQALRISGFPRHLSVHCGGVVIAPCDVVDYIPLTRSAKGFVITQMDMVGVEDLGLVKMDLLSNRSLGVLKDSLEMAERNEAVLASEVSAAVPERILSRGGSTEIMDNPGVFAREAARMKLAGTRRGTSVALAGVLRAFAGGGGNALPKHVPVSLRGRVFDFEHVTNDTATRALINSGRTVGCFYIESPGMRALFERLRCDNFGEVVAASSIIRPGVAESGMMQEYIVRHQAERGTPRPAGKRKASMAGHPAANALMARLLPETHGVMVYQEDVLKVAHEVAGMSYGEADILRRAMSGKMRSRDAMRGVEERFVRGAMERGIGDGDAREIWRQVASFAGYSFCKGHSAAFAVLSYQVSYLKAHHPAEFFAAVLSNGGGFYGAGAYLEEARRWGIATLPPCVNESGVDFTGATEAVGDGVARGWVRVGLGAVAGVSTRTRRAIVEARQRGGEYRSLRDFVRWSGAGAEECRLLIRVGALDCVAPACRGGQAETGRFAARERMLLELECLARRRELSGGVAMLWDDDTDIHRDEEDERDQGDGWNDDSCGAAVVGADANVRERARICRREAEILGFMVGGHPMDFVHVPGRVVAARDIRRHAGRRVRMVGWAIAWKVLATKNGRGLMKMLTLEDRTDVFEAVLFPRVYARYAPRTLTGGPYLVEGRVDISLGSPTLNIDRLELLR